MTICQIILSIILLTSIMSCKSESLEVKESKNEIYEADKQKDLKGDHLVHEAFQSIATEIWIDKKIDMKHFSQLSTPKKVIYTTYLLEMEVNNGGFNQFYYNRGYEIFKDIPQYMELIGASNHGQIVQEATTHILSSKREYSEMNLLDQLDNRFYDESKRTNILKLQAAYIQKNLKHFD